MKLSQLLENNRTGVTFDRKGLNFTPRNFTRGYAVALTDNQLEHATIKDIHNLEALARKLNLKKYYFGYWQNEKTGLDYLDLSLVINNKSEAVKIGQIFNQKAIFNFKTLESIYIK